MTRFTAHLRRLRRPMCCWSVPLLVAVVTAAQWTVLRHTHAADGLAQECQVCEQAPAFAHAAAPTPPALAAPAAFVPAAQPASTAPARRAPTPQARGPPISRPY